MRRTNIYLTPEEERELSRLAEERGTSKAAVVRELIDAGLGFSASRSRAAAAVDEAFAGWAERTEEELAELAALRRAR
jgi:predicted DNA-binding protein